MPITDISDLIENDLVEKEVLTDLGVTRMNASSQNGIYENVLLQMKTNPSAFYTAGNSIQIFVPVFGR